jgi:hypothetical protein
MNNVKFCYLYRDGSNFKSWGEVLFSNHENLSVPEIEEKIIHAFLPDKLFVASQISIPEQFLFADGKYTGYDHCYHEFDCLEECTDEPTDSSNRSISEFLQDIEVARKQGWRAFDILERT